MGTLETHINEAFERETTVNDEPTIRKLRQKAWPVVGQPVDTVNQVSGVGPLGIDG
jgi:hypothetical protein